MIDQPENDPTRFAQVEHQELIVILEPVRAVRDFAGAVGRHNSTGLNMRKK